MPTSHKDDLLARIRILERQFLDVADVYPNVANRIAFERDLLIVELQEMENAIGHKS